MPGRREGNTPVDAGLCQRCQNSEPVIISRGHSLCSQCFRRYVSTKIVKRMEVAFRVRDSSPGSQRKLLLPLSLGYCSNALLHVLSQHLKGQAQKSGRTGYQLHVLHVYDGASDEALFWEQTQQRYPEHTYSSCQLGELFEDGMLSTIFPSQAPGQPFASSNESDGLDDSDHFAHLMSLLPSATSRADVVQLLRRRLIVRFAKDHGCEAIVWGHSTTRLAERTLAETAKGRGFALPWLVADGESPLGVPSYYPLRELLNKEVVAFAAYADPPFADYVLRGVAGPVVNTRNATIDELMGQYFTAVENEYPSIVANVVRTTAKLQASPLGHFERHCELCEMPLRGSAPDRSRLCYGCIRNIPTLGP